MTQLEGTSPVVLSRRRTSHGKNPPASSHEMLRFPQHDLVERSSTLTGWVLTLLSPECSGECRWTARSACTAMPPSRVLAAALFYLSVERGHRTVS